MMRQRGYTVLPSSTTVQDGYEPQQHKPQQQQQMQQQEQQLPHPKFRTRSHQEPPQDDADVAAGSRLQRQERQLTKSTSFHSSPTTRLYRSNSSNIKSNTNDDGNANNNSSNNNSVRDSSNHALPNVDSYATLDTSYTIDTAPSSVCTINSVKGNTGDLIFFEDMITEPVMVLGIDISHLSQPTQFSVCAAGLFFFSLLYGYLQELLSVTLCSRQLGLYLATTQFAGYTVLAYIMRNFVYKQQQNFKQKVIDEHAIQYGSDHTGGYEKSAKMFDSKHVPLTLYLGLSVLRAIDLAMVCFSFTTLLAVTLIT